MQKRWNFEKFKNLELDSWLSFYYILHHIYILDRLRRTNEKFLEFDWHCWNCILYYNQLILLYSATSSEVATSCLGIRPTGTKNSLIVIYYYCSLKKLVYFCCIGFAHSCGICCIWLYWQKNFRLHILCCRRDKICIWNRNNRKFRFWRPTHYHLFFDVHLDALLFGLYAVCD